MNAKKLHFCRKLWGYLKGRLHCDPLIENYNTLSLPSLNLQTMRPLSDSCRPGTVGASNGVHQSALPWNLILGKKRCMSIGSPTFRQNLQLLHYSILSIFSRIFVAESKIILKFSWYNRLKKNFLSNRCILCPKCYLPYKIDSLIWYLKLIAPCSLRFPTPTLQPSKRPEIFPRCWEPTFACFHLQVLNIYNFVLGNC
jgi:hypothetical protein